MSVETYVKLHENRYIGITNQVNYTITNDKHQ